MKGRDYNPEPLNVWYGKEGFNSIDHSWKDDTFVSCSSVVSVWSPERQEPIHTFSYETESLLKARFNPAEVGLLAATSNERGVLLYDIRASSILRKVQMSMVSNDIAWNPREPMNFTVVGVGGSCESGERGLQSVHVRHAEPVAAADDASRSRGRRAGRRLQQHWTRVRLRELRPHAPHLGCSQCEVAGGVGEVAGNDDRYHTRRMQRIFCVNFSADGRFVLSGSDDTNIRIWKAQASAPLCRRGEGVSSQTSRHVARSRSWSTWTA